MVKDSRCMISVLLIDFRANWTKARFIILCWCSTQRSVVMLGDAYDASCLRSTPDYLQDTFFPIAYTGFLIMNVTFFFDSPACKCTIDLAHNALARWATNRCFCDHGQLCFERWYVGLSRDGAAALINILCSASFVTGLSDRATFELEYRLEWECFHIPSTFQCCRVAPDTHVPIPTMTCTWSVEQQQYSTSAVNIQSARVEVITSATQIHFLSPPFLSCSLDKQMSEQLFAYLFVLN